MNKQIITKATGLVVSAVVVGTAAFVGTHVAAAPVQAHLTDTVPSVSPSASPSAAVPTEAPSVAPAPSPAPVVAPTVAPSSPVAKPKPATHSCVAGNAGCPTSDASAWKQGYVAGNTSTHTYQDTVPAPPAVAPAPAPAAPNPAGLKPGNATS